MSQNMGYGQVSQDPNIVYPMYTYPHQQQSLPTWAIVLIVIGFAMAFVALVIVIILVIVFNTSSVPPGIVTPSPRFCSRLASGKCSSLNVTNVYAQNLTNTDDLNVRDDAYIGDTLTVQGNAYAASFITPSSSLIKRDITEASVAELYQLFKKIKPIRFRYTPGYAALAKLDPNRFYFGLSADQLARDLEYADLTIEQEIITDYENQIVPVNDGTNQTTMVRVSIPKRILMIRRERVMDILIGGLLYVDKRVDSNEEVDRQQKTLIEGLKDENTKQEQLLTSLSERRVTYDDEHTKMMNITGTCNKRLDTLELKVIALSTKPSL